MEQNIESRSLSNITALVLGNVSSFKLSENVETGADMLVAWLHAKKLNLITDRYEIKRMLEDKVSFDIIFISTNSKGADELLDSYNDCCAYVKKNLPDVYVVLVEEEMIVASQKFFQDEIIRILKKFDTCFDDIVFMSPESMDRVLEEFKNFVNSKKIEV